MKNNIFLIIFFIFFSSCSREKKSLCIKMPNTKETLFYILPSEEEVQYCQYYLYSTYFGEKNANCGVLRIIGDKVLVKFSAPWENHYEELFSFHTNLDTECQISIWHRNWEAGKGNDFVLKKYNVRLDTIFYTNHTKVAKLEIENLIHIDPAIGPLNAIIFFSSSQGFIGSYYTSQERPLEIIESRGDILKEKIDYSMYSFFKIK